MRFAAGLWRAVEKVMGVCYPAACAACRSFIPTGTVLCEECEGKLMELQRPGCARCGGPLAYEAAPCPWCEGEGMYPFQKLGRLSLYQGPMRTLIHHMKYHRRWPIAELLGHRLLQVPVVQEILEQADCLLPVPLHFLRQIGRGYNQSAVLAQALAEGRSLPLVRAVRRVRDTGTQTLIRSAKARRDNLRRAFKLIHPARVAGRHVVVVDDVMTSGATLQEVGRTLRRAKPASLSAIVLAIADPRHRGWKKV